MKRIAGVVLLTTAVLVMVSACTARPAPSDEAVAKWVAAESDAGAASVPGTIGTGSATSDSRTPDEAGEGMSFSAADGTPYTVTGLEVRCYGAESLPVRWELDAETESVGVESAPVPCDKKPHAISAHMKNVTKVTVNGLKTPSSTGWFVAVHGIPTPTDAQLTAWVAANEKKLKDAAPPHTLMAGLLGAGPGDPADASSVSASLATGSQASGSVETVQVACYGAPTMRLRLTVSGPTRDSAIPISEHKTAPIPCDKKTHVERLSIPDVAKLTIIGTDVTGPTSYLVFVTGTQK